MVFEKFPQNHFASQILTQFASVCLFNSQMDISALHLYTFFFFLWGNRIAYKCCILSRPFFPDLTPPHRHVPVSDPLALCAKFQWIFALNACACSLNKRNNLNGNPVPNWGAMVTMSAGGGRGRWGCRCIWWPSLKVSEDKVTAQLTISGCPLDFAPHSSLNKIQTDWPERDESSCEKFRNCLSAQKKWQQMKCYSRLSCALFIIKTQTQSLSNLV